MEYLSDSWFAAANRAMQAAGPAPEHLVIRHDVTDGPSWQVVTGPRPSITRLGGDTNDATGDGLAADAVFRQSAATARGVASGRVDAHQAFLLGMIRFDGDVEALIRSRPTLDWLEAALAPVMAATVFPPTEAGVD